MTARTVSTTVFGLLLLASGAVWNSALSRQQAISPDSLQTGQAYPLVVRDNGARIPLHASRSSRYGLIISNFGHCSQTAAVTLRARRTDEAHSLQVQPLAQIPMRAPRRLPPSLAAAPRLNALPADPPPQEMRTFHLHVTDGPLDEPRHYARVSANLVGHGNDVEVYLDAQQSPRELAPDIVPEIIRLFDDELIPAYRQTLADFRDIDANGRFTVLLTPWLSRLQGGKTSLGGFVRGGDFQHHLPAPFSNRCDMLYLNSNVTVGPHLKSLLAHEFAHATCFSYRLPSPTRPRGLPDDEDWLNEAIAHLAENIYGSGWSNLDYRISRYLLAPQDSPLVVNDYYRSGRWRDHGCRGATYLFLRWCVDQFGEQMLADLIRSPVTGVRNIEWATGLPFEELYRHWTLAVWRTAYPAHRNEQQRFTEFHSLELTGRLGAWQLAGPRCLQWELGDDPLQITLQGTATAYLEIRGGETLSAWEILASAENATHLQMTLVPLDGDSAPQFAARWSTGDSESASPGVRLQLHAKQPHDNWTLRAVSCERHNGDRRLSHVWNETQLAGDAQSLPHADGEPDELVLTLPVPASLLQTWQEQELWIKIIGEDAQGSRTIQHLQIPAPRPDSRQFAAGPAARQPG